MKKNCPGFTLIEMLVVVAIIAFLVSLGISAYNQFNRRQIVTQAALDLKNNLRMAQNKAFSGEKTCTPGALDGYEVYFSASSYYYRAKCGGDYSPGMTFSLPSTVSITGLPDLPSPNPILFKVLGQGTNVNGSTTITLTGFNDSTNTQTITVTASGEIK